MSKLNTLIIAPFLNRSGYGDKSDNFYHALKQNHRLNIKVLPCEWGKCSSKFLAREKDKEIVAAKIDKLPDQKPDLFVNISMPGVQPPLGKYNIIYSAIVETDKCYPQLVAGLNQYQLALVTSEYTKSVLFNSDLKPNIPVEVLYQGADTNIFKPDAPILPTVEEQLARIPEKECFLYVGQLTNGKPFCDRKDADKLIMTFLETFAGKPNKPALIMKVSGSNFSNIDRHICIERIRYIKTFVKAEDIPNIYLLHGELTENELASLFNHPKVIANLSFTHGEGFGISTLQGSLCAKPFFITKCSSNTEIITEPCLLLDGEMKPLTPDVVSEYFPAGSKWFYVDTEKAKAKLLDFFYNNRAEYMEAAQRVAQRNKEYFSSEKLVYRLNKIINKYVR